MDFGYEVGQFGKAGSVISVAELPSVKARGYWHMGGMSVSASGHIAVTCYNATRPADRKMEIPNQALKEIAKYTPKVFPGRNALWAIHVLDRYGKIIKEDAVPGSSQMAGISIDRNEDIYGLMLGPRQVGDAPYFNEVSCTAFKAKSGATRVLSAGNPGNGVPIPLDANSAPKRPPDIASGPLGKAWFEHAEWLYGGVGTAAKYISYSGGGCWCDQTQMTMDYFARSFLPESDTYSIAVLDAAGNLIPRIGQYGNTDDGVPLDGKLGPPHPRAIGGDEVALFTPRFLATHTDRRLFVSDLGNFRVLSVKLGYHTEERIALGRVPDSDAQ
ncbi:MAG: hypothetical protein L6R28_11045 [Planctomycetes bacterium]|nr:hypothetical protein [Planctomycetota bacterium]